MCDRTNAWTVIRPRVRQSKRQKKKKQEAVSQRWITRGKGSDTGKILRREVYLSPVRLACTSLVVSSVVNRKDVYMIIVRAGGNVKPTLKNTDRPRERWALTGNSFAAFLAD